MLNTIHRNGRFLSVCLLFAATASQAAPLGDYQGWLWETGVTNNEQDEELCFGRLDTNVTAGLTWTSSLSNSVCWGHRTTATGRVEYNAAFTPTSSNDRSTRALVNAGGNLYEVYGEEVIANVGQGEERLGTVLSTPTDDNMLLFGAYTANDIAGREYFTSLDARVKNTTAIRNARVADDLIGTWRIASYARLFQQLNREKNEMTIHTVTLSAGGVCSFTPTPILVPDGYTGNADFYAARYDDDGQTFANRNLQAEVIHETSTACSYSIDPATGYLKINNTISVNTSTERFVVADNNNFFVHAPAGTGLQDDPQDFLVGYRTASGFTGGEADGTWFFYLPLNGYDGSGTGNTLGASDVQELDSFGRGKLVFNSAVAGVAPPGEAGVWSSCDMELILNEEDRIVSGLVAGSSVSVQMIPAAAELRLDTCDYQLGADGALSVHASLLEVSGTTLLVFHGYIDATRDFVTVINHEITAGNGGLQDFAEARFATGVRYTGIATADADGDGFSNYQEFKIPLAAGNKRGDLDGDGNADILWRNTSSGQNWAYLMSGATILTSAGVNTVSDLQWQIVGHGDYDGNGTADILWRHAVTGQNWMYLMNGTTISSSVGVNTLADLDWRVAGSGDYNGDGTADILWRNSLTGQNWMYLMAGASISSSVGVNTISTAWTVAGDGDYNGDGSADILWRNTSTGQNWMYLMAGASISSSVGVNTVPLTWNIVSDGDFNGDGSADILWRNSATGQNWLYLMNGASISSSVGVNIVPTTWDIASSDDFNGDGSADILWRNGTTGQNWLYLMNGAAISSSSGVNTVSDLNWTIVNP